jgi:hypothetical protein
MWPAAATDNSAARSKLGEILVSLENCTRRYFVSYSGVKLPLNLITPIDETQLANRNTFFLAYFDAADRLLACEKITYGEVELVHCYDYYDSGALKRAKITNADDEITVLDFSEHGEMLGQHTG